MEWFKNTSEGSSRVVEIAPGKKVVLKNTRKLDPEPIPVQQDLRQASSEPGYFQSTSGVFGACKVKQFRQFIEKNK